jgi:hypothetical protein
MLPRLEKVLRKASRKTRGKIVIIGHSLGERRFSGVLRIAESPRRGQFSLIALENPQRAGLGSGEGRFEPPQPLPSLHEPVTNNRRGILSCGAMKEAHRSNLKKGTLCG